LYESLGFEITGEIVIGEGKVNADGEIHASGEGVKIWGMIWRPEARGSTAIAAA
jgi:hypothetical protein